MRNDFHTFGQFYKKIILIHGAILAGLIFFMGFIYFTRKDNYFQFDLSNKETLLGVVVGLIALIVPKLLFGFLMKRNRSIKNLQEKLAAYQTSLIVYVALLEGLGFFQIVQYLKEGNKLFLILAAISILFLLLARPNPDKIVSDLELSNEEQRYIDQPDKEFEK